MLKALLEQEPSTDEAVARIVGAPALIEEVRSLLPVLQEHARRPAGEDGVKRVVGRRFALFPQPERDEDEWGAWWSAQFDVLADLPEPALEAGMVAWARQPDSQFLPAPGKLRELALTTENRAARAYHRARLAVEYRPPFDGEPLQISAPTPRAIPEPTKADKDRVRAMAANFAAQAEARRPPQTFREPPPPAGIDEKGLSPEMRALMAKGEG